MARIVLHIGMNKTGTTAIQEYLRGNAAHLAEQGLLYPRTGREPGNDTAKHTALSDALGFCQSPKTGPATPAERKELRQRLDAEIAEHAPEVVFISSEMFVRRRRLGAVRNFFDGHDVTVLVYLRRHDHWWLSLYNQAVRTVTDPPWEPGFVGFYEFNRNRANLQNSYARLVNQWARIFGTGNIVVRPYERGQNDPDIVTDALRSAGAPEAALVPGWSDSRHNNSISAETLRRIDRVQRSGLNTKLKRLKIRYAMANDRNSACTDDPFDLMPPDLRRKLVEENMGEYARIARTYLHREDGRLFYEPLP